VERLNLDMTTNPLANQLAALLQKNGLSTTADTLMANAAQFLAIIPTDLLIPGLIWSTDQTYAKLPTQTPGNVYQGNYGSAGPQFTPSSPGAIAIDAVTFRQWQFASGIWT